MSKGKKRDLYQEITDLVVSTIEEGGDLPWNKEWEGTTALLPINVSTGRAYTGINVLLGMMAQGAYRHPYWVTYRQAEDMGGQVRKGEKGTRMVRYLPFWKENESDTKALSQKRAQELLDQGAALHFAGASIRWFTVFNIEQVEGLSPPESAPIEEVSATDLLRKSGAEVVWGYDPCYRSTECGKVDTIYLPTLEQFQGCEEKLFRVAAHELVHWTGHASRLARHSKKFDEENVGKSASSLEKYAFEELVAELGAAFLCAQQGFAGGTQHAAYIKGWLKALKSDKTFIFKAAQAAQKAVEYINEAQSKAIAKTS